MNFRKSYYQSDDRFPAVDISKFLSTLPLWIIDCSRQNEVVKHGAVDVRLEITATANFPANSTAYCLIISDSLVEYTPLNGIVRQII